MIISTLTIIFLLVLHLFPKRIREKVLARIKRVFARIRSRIRGPKYGKAQYIYFHKLVFVQWSASMGIDDGLFVYLCCYDR